jgi:hypothetical protein
MNSEMPPNIAERMQADIRAALEIINNKHEPGYEKLLVQLDSSLSVIASTLNLLRTEIIVDRIDGGGKGSDANMSKEGRTVKNLLWKYIEDEDLDEEDDD